MELREITEVNRAEVEALTVRPDQEMFIPGVRASLLEAAEIPDACPWYRGVYVDESPVGFVMISDNIPPGHPEYVGPYYLWRLLIDRRWQRMGYGRAVLDLIVDYVRGRPQAERLLTSTVPGDGSPLEFYLKYGFSLTGEVDHGELVLELQLSDAS